MPQDPVEQLLSQPLKLSKVQTPERSQTVLDRLANPTRYTPSQKLPYMTYDKLQENAEDIYAPHDFAKVGELIRSNVVKAIEARFPVVGERHTLKVENVHYENPKHTTLREEKEILLDEGSLSDRLKGDWVLYDNATGAEVARKSATLLNVPRMTSRGTFIRNGSEIGLKNMFRLRSGVYTHIKNNGVVAAHINPEQTTGQQMSIEMEPATGVMSIKRGTRTFGLLPMLRAAGMDDEAIQSVWGDQLYQANYNKYAKLMIPNNAQMDEYKQVWDEGFKPIKLDAETTESTLGKGFSAMSPEVLLRASNRILQVSRTMQDADADDRDSLRYQRVMGPADYIPERIVRDGGGLLRKLFNTVDKSGNLDAVVTGAFQPQVDSVFLDDKHAGYIDGSSPMESLDFSNMISRLGEGGIGSVEAAPAETRGVNDSYLGFVSPIRCYSSKHELLTKTGWKNIADITMDDSIACLINGQTEYHKPDHVYAYDYTDELYTYTDPEGIAYEVTGNHKMWVSGMAPSNCADVVFGLFPVDAADLTEAYEDGFYVVSFADDNAERPWMFESLYIQRSTNTTDGYHTLKPCVTGKVYCVTVPGHKVYTRIPGHRGFWCGNSPECGSEDTEVLTKDGWKDIADIEVNDIVAGIIDGDISWTPVLAMNSYEYDGEMIGYKDDVISFLVTPEHRCVFATCTTEFREKVVQAKDWDITKDNIVYIPLDRYIGVWKLEEDKYFREHYTGKVYCPTVEGGMVVFRRKGATHGVITGNSLKVGLDIYLTAGVMKGSNGKLYNRFIDKAGKPVVVPMDVTAKSIVATPELWDPKGDPNEYIPALVGSSGVDYVKRKDVDFFLENSNNMLSLGEGMIPLIGGIRSNRALMGCLHPDTMVMVVRDGELLPMPAFDLYTQRKPGDKLVSLSDDYSTVVYRDISAVYCHSMAAFPDKRTAHFNVRGRWCVHTMEHKWLVKTQYSDKPELLCTANILDNMEQGESYKFPVVYDLIDNCVYDGAPFSEVGEWMYADSCDTAYTKDADCEFVIDIDVDDHVYMLANGLFTHNSKYANQAVSLMRREAPLVQRSLRLADGTETTTEKYIGEQMGAKLSPVDGKVIAVDADSITIRGVDGKKHTVDLYNDYPANQKGFIHNTPKVKVGDKVQQRQLLAASNYTDDTGTAALGTNLRVAFLTARNAGTFEDGITISESAAQKLKSEQLYKLRGDTTDDIEYNKGRYLSLFKDEFTADQIAKIGDDGLPREGTVFEQGDPVYLGVQQRDIGVHGLHKNAAVPYVLRWEHSSPGTVTAVRKGRKHLTIYTKAYTPMEVGDKMCYDEQTEVFTDTGWCYFKDLTGNERVLTLDIYTGDVRLAVYGDKYEYRYKGKMYSLKTRHLDICVTPEHEHIVAANTSSNYIMNMDAKRAFGKRVYHLTDQNILSEYCYKCAQTPETEEKWIDYDGMVYCVIVPGTHTLFVRRNGKTNWSGNSSRYGAKGVVSQILPDEEMPKDQEGKPFEVLQSPLGLPSRLNTSMLVELQLAKIARKHGIKYNLPDFMQESVIDFTNRELKKYGMSPDEDLTDPVTGRTIPQVQTGELFFYKLKHMAELKERGRSTGTYSSEDVPLKGEGAARRLGSMEVSAVYSGGGAEVLRDAKMLRGQRNDEFWKDYRDGKYPNMPDIPLVHRKFFAHLQAAGVHLEDRGDSVHMYGTTQQDVERLTGGREVKLAATFESKNMQPVDGGLFDPTIFGADGDQWGYVSLPEPVLNPIMAKPIGAVLGWKDKELNEYLSGERSIDGKFGTKHLMETLDKIDLNKELTKSKEILKSSATTLEQRDLARKRLRAIEPMLREGKKPSDFFLTRMPILPPRFRPVTAMSNGVGIAADANFLYKRMMDAAEDLKEAKESLPEELQLDARKQLYNSVSAVTGLTTTDDPKLESKGVAGVLKWAFGKGSPKLGSLHRKVFGANLDLGSLGTIVPDNSLTIDQVGVPEESAWKMFEPFVVRKLTTQGGSMTTALRAVLDRTPEARSALKAVMAERPILLNRAPTLWRYGIQGQYGVLVDGNAIHVNPNICKLYNADFDGNCLDFDSKIFVKLSQSALDFFDKAGYIISNANQVTTKEEKMSVTKESVGAVRVSDGMFLMPIGKFPKVGECYKDKNGADVYGLPSGIEVLSADPVTGEHKFCKVTSFTEEKDCECVEVTIDSRKVIASTNATIAVFDHDAGKLVKVPAAEHNNRLVPVFRQCPVPFGDNYNRDFGWWMGALISDGWITDRAVGYTKMEDIKRAEFIRIARTIHENFVANEYRSGENEKRLAESVKVHLNGVDLASKCRTFGVYADNADADITDRSALRKQIPEDMINTGSEEFLYGLLSGLLDGDGSIAKNTTTKNVRFSCRLSTSSPYLRDSFEMLLYRLGIRWSTTVTPPRNWSKESYTICPSTVDMYNILDKLTCIGEREQELIAEWKNHPASKDDKDIVPISTAELDILRKNKLASIDASLYTSLTGKKAVTRASAMRFVDYLKNYAPEFVARLMMTNTHWRPISGLKEVGKRDVYDFAVPDTKVFAANNGIVVYDSMTTHVPVSKEAIQAIDQNMLPSRNLLSPTNYKAHFIPRSEFAQGLYLASRRPREDEATRRFRTKEEMMAALRKGEIKIDTPVVIG